MVSIKYLQSCTFQTDKYHGRSLHFAPKFSIRMHKLYNHSKRMTVIEIFSHLKWLCLFVCFWEEEFLAENSWPNAQNSRESKLIRWICIRSQTESIVFERSQVYQICLVFFCVLLFWVVSFHIFIFSIFIHLNELLKMSIFNFGIRLRIMWLFFCCCLSSFSLYCMKQKILKNDFSPATRSVQKEIPQLGSGALKWAQPCVNRLWTKENILLLK